VSFEKFWEEGADSKVAGAGGGEEGDVGEG